MRYDKHGNGELWIVEGTQGFVTDAGAFLDRQAAAEHALACGQINRLKFQPDTLFSEDVW